MSEMRIAVDAMGSDNSPYVEVEGAVMAAREFGYSITLVGIKDVIAQELRKYKTKGLDICIEHASQFITMDESPVEGLKRKKDSSIFVGARLVKAGRASVLVSAGNTGAVMACCKLVFGVLKGVDRPAIAAPLPTQKGVAIILDVGANVDCGVNQLVQFAIMGNSYAKAVFGISNPRVGLLNIGEEKGKGDDLRKKAYLYLSALPINFIGNIEGKEVYSGAADVVICDGFVGNVALKMSEGVANIVMRMLKDGMKKNLMGQLAYILMRGTLRDLKKRLDYSEYGGAPFLGLKNLAVISHGSSSTKAIKNAIKGAAAFAQNNQSGEVMKEMFEQCSGLAHQREKGAYKSGG